jgi:hypothetical protein
VSESDDGADEAKRLKLLGHKRKAKKTGEGTRELPRMEEQPRELTEVRSVWRAFQAKSGRRRSLVDWTLSPTGGRRRAARRSVLR